MGLFCREVEGHALIDNAIDLARKAADGTARLQGAVEDPLETPDALPQVDIGHLSKTIDRILCRAITEGCRKPLKEGLQFESDMFGECVKTEDMKIGIENFLENGPRAKAPFKHA